MTVADIANHHWPDVANPERLAGLRDLARQYRAAGYAVVLKDAFAGIFEFAQRIVGMENLLVMMITNEKAALSPVNFETYRNPKRIILFLKSEGNSFV